LARFHEGGRAARFLDWQGERGQDLFGRGGDTRTREKINRKNSLPGAGGPMSIRSGGGAAGRVWGPGKHKKGGTRENPSPNIEVPRRNRGPTLRPGGDGSLRDQKGGFQTWAIDHPNGAWRPGFMGHSRVTRVLAAPPKKTKTPSAFGARRFGKKKVVRGAERVPWGPGKESGRVVGFWGCRRRGGLPVSPVLTHPGGHMGAAWVRSGPHGPGQGAQLGRKGGGAGFGPAPESKAVAQER